ncbi:hypothetical protein DKL51_20570 [Micromonospora globispora]|nr:hypothetical protein DKL51_20570 [Micromonospora globispora]
MLRRPVESAQGGSQYTSRAFAAACRAAGIRQSMSAVGSSADNAAAESFNATFKRETLQGRRAFTDEREARLTAFRWLHRYNTVRRHSRLRQQSPITYEKNTRPAPATLGPAAETPCPGSGVKPPGATAEFMASCAGLATGSVPAPSGSSSTGPGSIPLRSGRR